MNTAQDLSMLSLILHASALAQAVMILLLGLSIASWTLIFKKGTAIRLAQAYVERFERHFWSGVEIRTLYTQVERRRGHGPLESIFLEGMREFLKAKEKGIAANAVLDASRRAMRAAFQREVDMLEAHLSVLASVGSVSPYLGLFGTVWGIMNAFRSLSSIQQQATLVSVAPGIAEALIATAIGLFAAIPAVLAYNHYTHSVDRLAIRFEIFIEEFLNLLQRQESLPL